MLLSLRQIVKELFTEKTRIVLTILAIAWGTFAISSMLAIGEGLRVTFAEAVAHSGHNLLTVTGGRTSKYYRGMHSNTPISLRKRDFRIIARLPNVSAVSRQYDTNKPFKYKNKVIAHDFRGVDTNYNKMHEIQIKLPGRFIKQQDIDQHAAVVVLGTKTAEDFFSADDNPVGKTIYMNNQPFLVIGVMKKKTQIAATQAPDERSNWIPATTYELLENPLFINSISIAYKNKKMLKQTKQNIQKIVALSHGVDPDDSSIVSFSDLEAQQEKINNFFMGMQIFLGIVGVLTLLVAGVGIANVMYASVSRSLRDIGIRMAVGARTYQILWHYIAEALSATVIGGVLGILMSALFVYGIKIIPMHGRLIDVIGKPHPILSLPVIAVVIVVLGITGFLAGLFPAIKATKVDPAETLSYE